MKKFCLWAMFVIVCPLMAAPAPMAVVPTKLEKFISVDVEKGKITALKTAVASYKLDDVTVDLIGVVHIGDLSYYKTLNKKFTAYDSLLYEMVGPKNAKPGKGDLDLMSLFVKFTLDLESQKAHINYHKANFVHADLSFKEMQDEMRKRGETLATLGLRVVADMIKKQILDEGKKPEEVAVGGDAISTKRVFAKQLSGDTGLMPAIEEILINDRNKAALKVMDKEMKNGKKRIAIFYGAAHMPDFEKRLLKQGFKLKSHHWLTAWDLSDD